MLPEVADSQSAQPRRDAEPHRGPFLAWMGVASIFCGCLWICYFVPLLPGLLIGVATYFVAKSDLRKMQLGVMDPSGYDETDEARRWGMAGLLLNLVILGLLGLIATWLTTRLGVPVDWR